MRVFAICFPILWIGIGCKKNDQASDAGKATQAPIRVATIVAAEKPTPDVLTITGTIIADQRAEVTADTQGKVINVMIERGQRVKLGQPVIQLDVRTAALSAREAQAALQAARVSKQLADDQCARTKALLDQGAITKEEFDRQNTQCLSAIEQVAQAQARNDMMSKSVADGMVRAPFEGVVSAKHVSPGEWVGFGKPLFTLVDTDPLKIELSVPEKAVTSIKIGDRVEVVAVAHPEKTFAATITRLAPEIGRSRSLIAEATLDGGTELVPGMFAEARVAVGQTTRVVVPAAAVIRRDKAWHVFVVRNGVSEERIVQVGPAPGPQEVSIAQGVVKGEKIVAAVSDQVVDGAKVAE